MFQIIEFSILENEIDTDNSGKACFKKSRKRWTPKPGEERVVEYSTPTTALTTLIPGVFRNSERYHVRQERLKLSRLKTTTAYREYGNFLCSQNFYKTARMDHLTTKKSAENNSGYAIQS